ncbi:MAG: radical SAM protein, partial [Moorella sp. (in: Bacteria)]|nr:radical SAM protein [Moorella sp. (in: firmicutes)]
QAMTIEEIVREAKDDEMFFLSSGGGVTISGGDPLYFPRFTLELARRLQDELLHVAIDTAAFCQWSYLDELRPYADLFLIDLKTMDGDKYRDVIRGSLVVVQQNLERLAAAGATIRVRIPVIPGFNDSEADYDAFAAYLGTLKGRIVGVDILPFHSYAGKKYRLLGRWDSYQYRDTESLQPE